MAKQYKSGWINNILVIGAVLLVVALIGGLTIWAAREDGLAVYVEHAQKRYTVNTVNNSLGRLDGKDNRFNVGSITGGMVDYSVAVTANEKANFDYVIGDQSRKFRNFDCSKVFTIQKHDNYFLLSYPDGLTLTEIISSRYGKDVLYDSKMPEYGEYFVLTVTTSYGKIAMPFEFAVGKRNYTDKHAIYIELSVEDILF